MHAGHALVRVGHRGERHGFVTGAAAATTTTFVLVAAAATIVFSFDSTPVCHGLQATPAANVEDRLLTDDLLAGVLLLSYEVVESGRVTNVTVGVNKLKLKHEA